MKTFKTMKEWKEVLKPTEMEVVEELYDKFPKTHFSTTEVLDAIVERGEPIESGYQIRSIISRVYGIELEDL